MKARNTTQCPIVPKPPFQWDTSVTGCQVSALPLLSSLASLAKFWLFSLGLQLVFRLKIPFPIPVQIPSLLSLVIKHHVLPPKKKLKRDLI